MGVNITLKTQTGLIKYATYNIFQIGDAASQYQLTVGGFSGTANDQFYYNNGMKFSTIDRDNDEWPSDCVGWLKGAWWYKTCTWTELNGPILDSFNNYAGAFWVGVDNVLAGTEMTLFERV